MENSVVTSHIVPNLLLLVTLYALASYVIKITFKDLMTYLKLREGNLAIEILRIELELLKLELSERHISVCLTQYRQLKKTQEAMSKLISHNERKSVLIAYPYKYFKILISLKRNLGITPTDLMQYNY